MNVKKIGKFVMIFGIVIIIAIAMTHYRINHADDPTPFPRVTNPLKHSSIRIKKSESKIYTVVGNFEVYAVRNDVAYICYFNDNQWDDLIPARSGRDPNWKPKSYPSSLTTVTFSLPDDSPFESAELKIKGCIE